MELKDLKNHNLPDKPGVYFFQKGSEVLYIGKATSLKDRTRSYFSNDLIKMRGSVILDMVTKSNKILYKETDTVLEALILETLLIKKHQPKYNIKEKDDKSFNFVVITKEDFPKVMIMRERELLHQKELKIKKKYGPFPSSNQLNAAIKIIRKIFPFYDQKKPSRLNIQIGIVPDPAKISKSDYQKNIKNIELFFEGKKNRIINLLKAQMKDYVSRQEFEKANIIKKQLFSLGHLNDITILMEKDSIYNKEKQSQKNNINKNFTIESYDVSHIAGTSTVGVMTVMINNEFNKNLYRKFLIKSSKLGDDLSATREILLRRFKHSEWSYPDLVVVDGGINHKHSAESILDKLNLKIPVLAVVKDEHHRPIRILGLKNKLQHQKSNVLRINDETHRFAIKFHRQKRKNDFFK